MTGNVLILGPSGRFGRHAAEAFWNAGWRVTPFDRKTDDLMAAAQGMDLIVNGWNPAYPDWAAQLPGLTAQVIAAARASGATVLLTGNVYVFGQGAPETFGPDTPHRATNPLGRLRIDMEQAYRDSGVRTILLRAGDFLDTAPSGNWFDQVMAPSLRKGVLTYPGDPEMPHAWAFLPDLARGAATLAERRPSLPDFADIAYPGYTLTGRDLAALCAVALGRDVRVKRMTWLPLHLARPFWRMAGPLIEMRYLWSQPHRMDSGRFETLLPAFVTTDPAEAVAQAISAIIPEAEGRSRPADADPRPFREA